MAKLKARTTIMRGILVMQMADVVCQCQADDDPAPYALVVNQGELDRANEVWACFAREVTGVSMEIVPDQGCETRAVLLFTKETPK